MNSNKFWPAMGKAFAVVTVTLLVTLVFAPNAGAASKYKVLHAFSGGDGEQPRADLVFDAAGNLYSTTAAGGIGNCWVYGGNGCGTVFKLAPNPDGSWTESVLYRFTGGEDGANPWSTPVFDAAGNLYGTTMYGGTYGYGTVYTLVPNPYGSWTQSVLYSFMGGTDGNQPYTLAFDTAGTLYGTTWYGGTYGYGTVYTLVPNPDGSWTQSVIYSFTGGKDGGYLLRDCGLTFDAAGNLYSAALSGGAYGYGVTFELTPKSGGGWKEKVLHTFVGTPAKVPAYAPIFDAAGNLYGTTSAGGTQDAGTIYKLTPASAGKWTYKVIHIFNVSNGADPLWIKFDTAGNLYGTTYGGGTVGCEGTCGTVYKLTPNPDGSWKETIVHRFKGSDGGQPEGLVLDSAGNLYGLTAYYGAYGAGVVFEITP